MPPVPRAERELLSTRTATTPGSTTWLNIGGKERMDLLKKTVKWIFSRLGYQILPAPRWATTRGVTEKSGYRLVNWKNAAGEYDLAAYRREQELGNRAKIVQVWTSEDSLQFISHWLKDRGLAPQLIICHGTRNGFEQKIFSGFFNCEVIGTEISPTAVQFPMTVQADFHDLQPQWERRADIVYSNSLDHAYDPAKALQSWAAAVKDGGVIVLEKASDSDPRGASDLDPFAITLPSLVVFLLEALGDIASVRALIDVPRPRDGASYHKMIVVEIDRRTPWGVN
jgi:SAM-dependent methyltransferase